MRYLQTTFNNSLCTHKLVFSAWIHFDLTWTDFDLNSSQPWSHALNRSKHSFVCGRCLVKQRFSHLIGTFHWVWPSLPTARCDDRWQRAPLCSADPPEPTDTKWHLRQTLQGFTSWHSHSHRHLHVCKAVQKELHLEDQLDLVWTCGQPALKYYSCICTHWHHDFLALFLHCPSDNTWRWCVSLSAAVLDEPCVDVHGRAPVEIIEHCLLSSITHTNSRLVHACAHTHTHVGRLFLPQGNEPPGSFVWTGWAHCGADHGGMEDRVPLLVLWKKSLFLSLKSLRLVFSISLYLKLWVCE